MEKDTAKDITFLAKLAEKAAESTDLHLLIQNIIGEIIDYMEAASCSIMVYDDEEDCLKLYVSSAHPMLCNGQDNVDVKKVALKDSIAAEVFKTGKAVIENNKSPKASTAKRSRKTDEGSFMSVPLKINRKIIGVINFNRTSDQEAFHEVKDLEKLNIINTIIASLIDKEAILEKLKENALRNKIFLDISKDLGSTLDPYIILQKSFEQFSKVISYTSISILLYDELENGYKLIVQPDCPISLEYQNHLSKSIFDLFNEYPSEPALTKENFAQPTIFNPQSKGEFTVGDFEHVLHLPIILGGSVKGLIHLARTSTEEAFTAKDLNITSQFTGIFITSIKNALIHKRTEKLAFTDPLTELYNHRFFQETLQQEFTRSIRYQKPLSLMILDIDFFKKFNDTYGHLVGDKVLRHVSSIFKASIREQIDTVARYGGEEFAVILPETSLEGAAVFAERIRSKVEESVVENDEQSLKVTISIGVSCVSVTKCSKTSDLIEAADQALYKAKLNGRNQYQTFNEPEVSYEKTH